MHPEVELKLQLRYFVGKSQLKIAWSLIVLIRWTLVYRTLLWVIAQILHRKVTQWIVKVLFYQLKTVITQFSCVQSDCLVSGLSICVTVNQFRAISRRIWRIYHATDAFRKNIDDTRTAILDIYISIGQKLNNCEAKFTKSNVWN